MSSIAAMALVLAGIGIYGMVAFLVARRRGKSAYARLDRRLDRGESARERAVGVTPDRFVVALAAAYLPARRAARVDPMAALRYDG